MAATALLPGPKRGSVRARVALLVLALVPSVTAAAPVERDRGGWVEVVPAWTRGPATISWNGTSVEVAPSSFFATDQETWLYVADHEGHEPSGGLGCPAPQGNAMTGQWVLLDGSPCVFAAFPGVACWGTAACDPVEDARSPVVVSMPTPTPRGQMPDSCGRVPGAMCTPGLPLGGVLLGVALAAAALMARASGRGRGPS